MAVVSLEFKEECTKSKQEQETQLPEVSYKQCWRQWNGNMLVRLVYKNYKETKGKPCHGLTILSSLWRNLCPPTLVLTCNRLTLANYLFSINSACVIHLPPLVSVLMIRIILIPQNSLWTGSTAWKPYNCTANTGTMMGQLSKSSLTLKGVLQIWQH